MMFERKKLGSACGKVGFFSLQIIWTFFAINLQDIILKIFGGSQDEDKTVRDFLGRDFSDEAFLEEIGLKK